MKINILISTLIILINSVCLLYPQKADKKISAYLGIKFQNAVLFTDNSEQSNVKKKIEKIFNASGFKIIPEQRIDTIETHKLFFDITISDSLKISANGSYVDLAVAEMKYPDKVFSYKSETDILKSVKKYLKDFLHHKHK